MQAAIYGDGTAKRKAMERTTDHSGGREGFSIRIRYQDFCRGELFRVPTVTRRRPCIESQEASLVAGVLTGSILGIFAGAGSIYYAWVVYVGDAALPLGLLVAYLTVSLPPCGAPCRCVARLWRSWLLQCS